MLLPWHLAVKCLVHQSLQNTLFDSSIPLHLPYDVIKLDNMELSDSKPNLIIRECIYIACLGKHELDTNPRILAILYLLGNIKKSHIWESGQIIPSKTHLASPITPHFPYKVITALQTKIIKRCPALKQSPWICFPGFNNF